MNSLMLASVAALLFVGGQHVKTHYPAERALLVEVETTFSMETTDFSMERDGEPMESRFGGGGGSTETRHVVMKDTVAESKDGQPVRVMREFVRVSADSVMTRGEEDMESSRECPLHEVTLELTLSDGEVIAEVAEGDEPDDEAVLEGHHLALSIDALLPSDEVEAGDDWELDGEALKQALLVDLESSLFPRPERPEGEGERGGRGGGRRGMRGGRGGASAARFVTEGVWDAKATLVDGTEEYAGVECLVIAIEGECVGTLPEPERGEGGGRRRGGGGRALNLASPLALENSFEMEIEGKLYFDAEAKRPVHLELEGALSTESTREMTRNESTMVISSAQEGTFTYTVDLSEVAAEDDDE